MGKVSTDAQPDADLCGFSLSSSCRSQDRNRSFIHGQRNLKAALAGMIWCSGKVRMIPGSKQSKPLQIFWKCVCQLLLFFFLNVLLDRRELAGYRKCFPIILQSGGVYAAALDAVWKLSRTLDDHQFDAMTTQSKFWLAWVIFPARESGWISTAVLWFTLPSFPVIPR